MREFENTILRGDVGGDALILASYGLYLANGGTPEGFMDLTAEDVQIMFMVQRGFACRDIEHLALRFGIKSE